MIKYSIKRLFQSLISVLIVATVVFCLMRLLPKDKYFTEDELMKYNEQEKEEILRAQGVLDPIPTQLGRFYGQLLQLDFGKSMRMRQGKPVMDLVVEKAPYSFYFGIRAAAVAFFLGNFLGICQTLNKDGIVDHLVTGYTIIVNAVPALVLYSLILMFGSRVLGLPSLYSPRRPELSSILPIFCLSLGGVAGNALWMRRYMVDELNKDYIKLARIKGLSSPQIMIRHVFRNAFIPMSAGLPGTVIGCVSGSLLVESFFSIPGMGGIVTTAIGVYDLTVVQTMVIIYTSMGVISVFLGDLTMMLLDPRISLVGKEESR